MRIRNFINVIPVTSVTILRSKWLHTIWQQAISHLFATFSA
ncbi:9851_t:CDS:2 [Entrophospora sp. SA101]|nr:9851_t:CDS:2 [Entrophospora sp. SA101]